MDGVPRSPLDRLSITAVRSNETFVPIARRPFVARQPIAQHVTIDLYGCKDGASFCRGGFLSDLAAAMETTRHSDPIMHRTASGISGWLPLLEGCIQLHTVAAKNFVLIDIYCDRRFHSGKVLKLARSMFEPKQFEMKRIPRGLKHCEVT